jgi:hypothetical protein
MGIGYCTIYNTICVIQFVVNYLETALIAGVIHKVNARNSY